MTTTIEWDEVIENLSEEVAHAGSDFVISKKTGIASKKSQVLDLITGKSNLYQNAIINPFMIVDQRAITTATAYPNDTYTVDRFVISENGTNPQYDKVTTSQPTALPYSNSIKLTSQATESTWNRFVQFIEDKNYFHLRNKIVTFSAWVKSNSSDCRIGVFTGIWTDRMSAVHTGGGAWEKLSVTFTMEASPSAMTCTLGIQSVGGGTVSVTNGDYCEITGVQFNLGSNSLLYMP